MSAWLDPALKRLLWLKLRGRWRVALRRLRTPKGFVFGLLGGGLFALWVVGLALRLRAGDTAPLPRAQLHALASLAITIYAVFALTANLSWRGLYLPRSEVERLFAAPVARPALVRFRLLGMFVPTAFVAIFLGIVTAARVPAPAAGFLGGVLVVATSTVLGQGAALLAAREDGRLARLLARLPSNLPRLVGALGLAAVLLLLLFADDLGSRPERVSIVRDGRVVELPVVEYGGRMGHGSRDASSAPFGDVGGDFAARLASFARHPATRAVTGPAYPLASALSAPSLAVATPWLLLSLGLLALLFEGVARLAVDFREASLSTSREVERRLARLRRGQFGAAGSEARALVGWRVPWLYGTSPFAAVLWLKTATLLRQGRGALSIAFITTALGVLLGVFLLPEPRVGTIAIAVLGVAYLASGLRFDFRSELDRMELVRAWPLAPWQVFVAVILPVTLFVAGFVALLLLIRGVLLHDLSLEVLLVMSATPLVAFLWIALDNAVFLLFPVRFIPGQGGALQHSGRALVMVALRLGLIAGVALGAALAAVGGAWVGDALALGPAVIAGLAATSALMVLLGAGCGLAAFGGYTLARFDPAEASLAQD